MGTLCSKLSSISAQPQAFDEVQSRNRFDNALACIILLTVSQGHRFLPTLLTKTVPAIPLLPAKPVPGNAQSSPTMTNSALRPSALARSTARPKFRRSPAVCPYIDTQLIAMSQHKADFASNTSAANLPCMYLQYIGNMGSHIESKS